MNDFFQNMLKQTSTNIAKINSTINSINNTIPSNNTNNNTKIASETMDLSPAGILNSVTKLINPQTAKTFLQGSGADDANHAFSAVLTGDAAKAKEGVKGLLNAFNALELPFPIITNGATISTKNTFTSAEIDAIANAVGDGIAAYGKGTNAFVNYLYNNVDASGVGTSWENANNLAAENLKSALSNGQIAHIDAYDGAAGAGADQEIARAQAIVSGGQAASENFDATKVATAYGDAIGKTVDNVGKALTGGASAVMDTVDVQAVKNSLVQGLDAGWAGAGTALAKNANLREGSINNFLNAFGFNANGTWNGNIDPITAIPQGLLAMRDIAQTYAYIPQIAYDSTAKTYTKTIQKVIENKNAQYGETTKVTNYTSLGDSVESGLGLQDYYAKFVNGESNGSPLVANTVVDGSAPDLVADALGAECHQYHMPGARTSEFLYLLDPDEYFWAMDPITPIGIDPMQGLESALSSGQYSPDALKALSPKVREDIANSEVVTLDVGWNDWWSMIAEGGFIRSNIQYMLLLKEINEINPDAELVLVGGYNPFNGWDIFPGMDDNIFSYGAQALQDIGLNLQKSLVCLLYPGKCTYADTRGTEIQQSRPSVFGVSLDDMGIDPHPTEEGAKHQANGILEALGFNNVLYEEQDKGDFHYGQQQFESADLGMLGLLNGIPSEYNYLQKGIERSLNALRPNTVNTNANTSNDGMLTTMGLTQNVPSNLTGTQGVVNAVGDTVKEMMTLSSGNGVSSKSSMLSSMAAAKGVQDGNVIGTAASVLGSAATTIAPNLIFGALGGVGSFLKGLIPGL